MDHSCGHTESSAAHHESFLKLNCHQLSKRQLKEIIEFVLRLMFKGGMNGESCWSKVERKSVFGNLNEGPVYLVFVADVTPQPEYGSDFER